MKYAYEYQNRHTRGWTRGEFDDFSLAPTTPDEALFALEAVARSWTNDTDFRVVEIDDAGKETPGSSRIKGTRGPMPVDKKDR
jgi:hypothetical protein